MLHWLADLPVKQKVSSNDFRVSDVRAPGYLGRTADL